MKEENKKTKRFAVTGMFLGLTIALSSFGIPVPGGHLYFNDMVIVTAALLLDPHEALLVGGLGAFLGDAIFYPAPMFVSLITHGLQAYVISIIAHENGNLKSKKTSILAVLVGAIIMVSGYSLGRAFIYATKEAAYLKLPFQIIQALFGCVVSIILVYQTPLYRYFKERFS